MELLVYVPSLASGYIKLGEGITEEDDSPTYRIPLALIRRVRCGESSPAKHAFQVISIFLRIVA